MAIRISKKLLGLIIGALAFVFGLFATSLIFINTLLLKACAPETETLSGPADSQTTTGLSPPFGSQPTTTTTPFPQTDPGNGTNNIPADTDGGGATIEPTKRIITIGDLQAVFGSDYQEAVGLQFLGLFMQNNDGSYRFNSNITDYSTLNEVIDQLEEPILSDNKTGISCLWEEIQGQPPSDPIPATIDCSPYFP